MDLRVLYDRRAKSGFLSGEGFSCLVDGKVLFDTGEVPSSLIANMNRMKVKTDKLEAVVISHDHWDHTSGLWEILRRRRGLKVYACPSFNDTFKQCVSELGGELITAVEPMEIAPNIFVTGELAGEYNNEYLPEQALVLKGDKGTSVLTGCAHPGILNILRYTKKNFDTDKIYMVLGGFHLDGMDREAISKIITGLKEIGVKKTGPAHCSGEKAMRIFSGQYHRNCMLVKAGSVFHV
ncbi:MAG: MBL fold metallo-hydrolase [Candidatus Omnitrophota bacterium]|nr:MBL fold metallo-hydrolase [Candidatus Omnitrophota bacterium]